MRYDKPKVEATRELQGSLGGSQRGSGRVIKEVPVGQLD